VVTRSSPSSSAKATSPRIVAYATSRSDSASHNPATMTCRRNVCRFGSGTGPGVGEELRPPGSRCFCVLARIRATRWRARCQLPPRPILYDVSSDNATASRVIPSTVSAFIESSLPCGVMSGVSQAPCQDKASTRMPDGTSPCRTWRPGLASMPCTDAMQQLQRCTKFGHFPPQCVNVQLRSCREASARSNARFDTPMSFCSHARLSRGSIRIPKSTPRCLPNNTNAG